ncbi:MAG: helix-turn-helix transcriptional regulator [Treponema sp.]|nr:helix-turn-helix transcriptional regulator [Treponema sp.]MBR7079637.1 helix-turn-helix transcriptional regulator [Treponema sp.]
MFGEIVRKELVRQKMDAKELSAKTGIPYSTLLAYLDKRQSLPNIVMGCEIARVLGVSAEYLVTGQDIPCSKTLENNLLALNDAITELSECLRSLLRYYQNR